MSQSEIAQQLDVQGATVTDMLQCMEETGLVYRERDADDNRIVRVYLPPMGGQKERLAEVQLRNISIVFERDLPPH